MTPSKRRRMGREAYEPGEDPMNHLPWKKGTWGYDIYNQDFLDGWAEAKAEEKMQNESENKYVPLFDIHYKCKRCGREILTNALKTPRACPFCLDDMEKVD